MAIVLPINGSEYRRTARDLIADALMENGIIGTGEMPEAEEFDACIVRLNNMIKSWGVRGVTWKQDTISVSGLANDPIVILPGEVREVNGARYIDSAVNERAMTRWERDEYMILPNKAARGTPSIYYVEKTQAGVNLRVWQVPTADFTLSLDVDMLMSTITYGGDFVDIPDEWMETVMTNLALRCGGIFQKEPSNYLLSRAQQLETEMFDSWRPASYYLGPY